MKAGVKTSSTVALTRQRMGRSTDRCVGLLGGRRRESFEVANVRGGFDDDDHGDEMQDVLANIAGSVEMNPQPMGEESSDILFDHFE
ncbi:hypothetical protein PanWU01x14_037880 [Parasponia andersonii]|uniref:Uncharacterized protein n=1 Tax=Parasponia andersonii TaxID=3476 RepID=A0A2P5DS23_PARAD|nr:hypothetical protein PanWU01x14_037880 [Parasponia andersonii]